MPTADEICKQVEELTVTLVKTEAAEKAKKEQKEMERKWKAKAKQKADREEKEAAEKTARAGERKASRFVVPDSETDEISEVDENRASQKSCTMCIKHGCKCIIVVVSFYISNSSFTDFCFRKERLSPASPARR